MSLVRSKKSPITGSVVVADVVLRQELETSEAGGHLSELKEEILQFCHEHLAKHKIPATIRFLPTLDVGAAGKLVRPNA